MDRTPVAFVANLMQTYANLERFFDRSTVSAAQDDPVGEDVAHLAHIICEYSAALLAAFGFDLDGDDAVPLVGGGPFIGEEYDGISTGDVPAPDDMTRARMSKLPGLEAIRRRRPPAGDPHGGGWLLYREEVAALVAAAEALSAIVSDGSSTADPGGPRLPVLKHLLDQGDAALAPFGRAQP